MVKKCLAENENHLHYGRMKKLFCSILLSLFFVPFVVFAGDGTGADPLFDSTGVEKPAEWDIWNKTQKHEYLQENGLYPPQGQNLYEGEYNQNKFALLQNQQNREIENLELQEEKKALPSESILETKSFDFSGETPFTTPWLLVIFGAIVLGLLVFLRRHYTVLQWICFFGIPAGILGLTYFFPEKILYLYFGYIAEGLFIFVLFVKPLAVLTRARLFLSLLGFRKELGLATFWFAFFHSVLFIYQYNMYDPIEYLGWTSPRFYAAAALFGFFLLAVTSNEWSICTLKRHWKQIQYIAYPVFVFTYLHIGFVSGEWFRPVFVLSLYFLLKILEWSMGKFWRKHEHS